MSEIPEKNETAEMYREQIRKACAFHAGAVARQDFAASSAHYALARMLTEELHRHEHAQQPPEAK